jgi:hypothetical protein
MTLTPNQKTVFAITALLIWTLACRAATRLIIPDTPTPLPATSTFTAVPTQPATLTPFPTPTALLYEASCPGVVQQIMHDSVSTDKIVHGSAASIPDDLTYLIHYSVYGDQLKTPLPSPVDDDLQDEQQDRATQAEIWELYTHLIPAEQRAVLRGFAIFTDGKENYLASVNPSRNDPYRWDLNVDIADAGQKTSLTYTLLHEQGHLLTLTKDQVDVSVPLYHFHDEETYKEERDACPQYFTGKGCSHPDSYINIFFERFWTEIYSEWLEIDEQENDRTRENELALFFKSYQDQFVTEYAAASPAEDIAESFTFFILSPKPERTSIASEKILFFYEFPELVELRMQILKNICVEFHG